MATRGHIIAITGVTGGLGLSMAERFHEIGHTVVGCGRNKAAIEELNKKYSDPAGNPKFSVVNVCSDGEVEQWSQHVTNHFGCPKFLLNNAGMTNKNAELWNVPVEEFNRVIDVNINGTVNCIRHFVPRMIKKRAGVIVNFSSGWGRSVAKHVAPYCCSKWGIEGLTQAFALELPPPLAAVALDPGMINTQMLQTAFGSSAAHYGQNPKEWAVKACDYILGITRSENGQRLSVG